MSKTGRTYTDSSYVERKTFSFERVSAGTRGNAQVTEAGQLTVLSPIKVTDWNILWDATAASGTSTWVLAKGTVGLGTLSFVADSIAGTTVEGSITETTLAAGDVLRLYSGTAEADPAPFVTARVEYVEIFDIDDN